MNSTSNYVSPSPCNWHHWYLFLLIWLSISMFGLLFDHLDPSLRNLSLCLSFYAHSLPSERQLVLRQRVIRHRWREQTINLIELLQLIVIRQCCLYRLRPRWCKLGKRSKNPNHFIFFLHKNMIELNHRFDHK